jgi:putative tryptophan/tyrosine transport system substrate-binding protein
MMDRRRFLFSPLIAMTTLRMATATPGLLYATSASAQARVRVPTIGYLSRGFSGGRGHDAFRQGLRDLGYDEDGTRLLVHHRFAEGNDERLAEFASELVRLNVDVIVASAAGVGAARKLTSTIPVVFLGITDPVGFGFVKSLARPGGNMTGFSYAGVELNPKRLEILREALPHAKRFAALATSKHTSYARVVNELGAAAKSLGVSLQIVDVGEPSPSTIDIALDTIGRSDAQGILVLQDNTFVRQRERIVRRVSQHRIAAMYELREYVEVGGLISYDADLAQQYRSAAGYVDKILKGATPADLPVQEPTKFDLVINLKTAKALGLTIPPSVLGRADHVIE